MTTIHRLIENFSPGPRGAALTLALLSILGVALGGCQTPNRGYSESESIAESKGDTADPGTVARVKKDAKTDEFAQNAEAAQPDSSDLEYDICRPGSTFRTIRGEQAKPTLCRDICDRLMDCMAATYLKATETDGARCELKHSIPPAVSGEAAAQKGCVSWVNPRAKKQLARLKAQGFELRSMRPGNNLREIELDRPDPAICQTACDNLIECAAFTYIRPSQEGQKARCELKTQAQPPITDQDCCISGVK